MPLVLAYCSQIRQVLSSRQQFASILLLATRRFVLSVNPTINRSLYLSRALYSDTIYSMNRIGDSSDPWSTPALSSIGSDSVLSNSSLVVCISRQLLVYCTTYIGKPYLYRVSNSCVQFTVSKVPLILSCNSEATTLQLYTVQTTSVTIRIASSVDLFFQFPIWLFGSSPCDLVVSVIRLPITASMSLLIVLSREIGLQLPTVCYCFIVLLGFRMTTIPILRKHYRKYSNSKLAWAILAKIFARGSLQAFRNPVRRLSLGPSTFQVPVLYIRASISTAVTI